MQRVARKRKKSQSQSGRRTNLQVVFQVFSVGCWLLLLYPFIHTVEWRREKRNRKNTKAKVGEKENNILVHLIHTLTSLWILIECMSLISGHIIYCSITITITITGGHQKWWFLLHPPSGQRQPVSPKTLRVNCSLLVMYAWAGRWQWKWRWLDLTDEQWARRGGNFLFLISNNHHDLWQLHTLRSPSAIRHRMQLSQRWASINCHRCASFLQI